MPTELVDVPIFVTAEVAAEAEVVSVQDAVAAMTRLQGCQLWSHPKVSFRFVPHTAFLRHMECFTPLTHHTTLTRNAHMQQFKTRGLSVANNSRIWWSSC